MMTILTPEGSCYRQPIRRHSPPLEGRGRGGVTNLKEAKSIFLVALMALTTQYVKR